MKKANNSFDEIMEWVLSAETIALAGHTNPDGDAIGACLALGGALEKAGKQVQVILEKYADKYQLIPNGHLVCAAEDARLPELFLVLDCGDEGRLGDAAEIFQKAAAGAHLVAAGFRGRRQAGCDLRRGGAQRQDAVHGALLLFVEHGTL